nr:hypothetical protein [Lentzea alba]
MRVVDGLHRLRAAQLRGCVASSRAVLELRRTRRVRVRLAGQQRAWRGYCGSNWRRRPPESAWRVTPRERAPGSTWPRCPSRQGLRGVLRRVG